MLEIEPLKKHKAILVTGPHRAGTRITSKILAHDLGYRWRPESNAEFFGHHFRMLSGATKGKGDVFQAPTMCAWCHLFHPEVAIVMCVRNVQDILASEERIGWGSAGKGSEINELKKYFRNSGTIAEVKYECWTKYQKSKIRYPYEIRYEDLSVHPMFVPKEQRQGFKPHQTEIEETK